MPSNIRSKGCHACRRMKVKCDEHRPHCQRCQKAGRECPGYRLTSEVVFRSMNETAEESSRRKISKPRRKPDALVIRNLDSDHEATESPPSDDFTGTPWRRRINRVDQPLPTDWNQQARCAFFYDYVILGVKEGRGGFLDFLPGLYRDRSDKQYFVEALTAVSMASFANRTSMEHLARRARISYGRTLSLINEALNDPAEVKDDCLLTSLFLLGTYEDISGDKETLYEAHGSGQMEILRLRGSEQFSTVVGRNLYRHVKSRQRMRDLNQCCEPREAVNPELESFGPAPHAAKLAIMLSQVGKVCSDVRRQSITELQTRRWVVSALELYQGMKDWVEYAPDLLHYWFTTPIASSPGSKSKAPDLEFDGVFVFKHIQIATGWNLLWCARIFLLQAVLEYRDKLSPDNAEQCPLPSKDDILPILRETVDNICATVPFCLGEIDRNGALNTRTRPQAIGAYFLVWVLYVASSVICVSPTRETWILDRMLHISNVMGIRQAATLRKEREMERAQRQKQAGTISSQIKISSAGSALEVLT